MAKNRPLHYLKLQRGLEFAQARDAADPPIANTWRELDTACTTLQLRRHQKLPLHPGDQGKACLLLAGLLVLECEPVAQRRRIVRLYYPGSIIRTAIHPELNEFKAAAAVPTSLLQLKWKNFEELLRKDTSVADHYHQQSAEHEMRDILHGSGFGVLSGAERVAALMIEFALKLGRPTNSGLAFDMPLSRSEMADYLALNPDTMSRIMSRMKANGTITLLNRSHAVVRNFDALLEACPIAPALMSLHEKKDR